MSESSTAPPPVDASRPGPRRGERTWREVAHDHRLRCVDRGLFDEAGIPVMLVGDSAAMVVYGHDSTIPVTVDELIPLVAAVVRGSRRAMVVADLPFGSYQQSPQQALATATRFMKEAGAHAVKLEGGERCSRTWNYSPARVFRSWPTWA